MSQHGQSKITFAYWALRGKPHVIRLTMKYLGISYQELTFRTPEVFYKDYKESSNEDCELPFIIDQGCRINETVPILTHILNKFKHSQFVGRTVGERNLIHKYLISIDNLFRKIISCSLKRATTVEQAAKHWQDCWNADVKDKLQWLQKSARTDHWFLRYLSVMDFGIYELVQYLRTMFPSKVAGFPKLLQISSRVYQLPSIKAYCNSKQCKSLCYLPVQMCKRYGIKKVVD